MTATSMAEPAGSPTEPVVMSATGRAHPIAALLARRVALGVVSVLVVSIIVFFATLILPGDAATAILGQQATPARLVALRHQLGLDRSAISAFWSWFTGCLQGHFGTSLTQNRSVLSLETPRLENSAVLVVLASVCSTAL